MHTIFARSSGPGKAGVAVFRISGDRSLEALNMLLKDRISILTPNMMYYKKLYIPNSDELIDEAMVVYFKGPHSFTGEDVVELHLHGSIAIYKIITKVLLDTNLVHLAEAGEFTKRAFLNSKFDLTAAEGLADLIEAETIMQHKQAIKQKSGVLENLYSNWRRALLQIIALLEAYIDFPDEEIPVAILEQVSGVVFELKTNINSHLADNRRGERLRQGLKISILGAPNVGKSSLLNFLLERDMAIVSDIPGTTRDIIEGHIDIGGYPIILQDTAGLRDNSNDQIEQEGIKRSMEVAKEADIKIIMFDANDVNNEILDDLKEVIDNNTIFVVNKIDLLQEDSAIASEALAKHGNREKILLSLKQNLGTEKILEQILEIAENLAGLTEAPQITRERHRHQLKQALTALESFNLDADLVLAAEDIRMTIRFLSNITGAITVEEILGEIFGKFCIGK